MQRWFKGKRLFKGSEGLTAARVKGHRGFKGSECLRQRGFKGSKDLRAVRVYVQAMV